MILYVNGDSNSSGHELNDQSCSWPNSLAAKLKLPLVNQATAGGSNPSILRTTKKFLEDNNNQNVFVVIGWTSWEREEWFYNNCYYNVNASGCDIVPAVLQKIYKEWVVKQDNVAQSNKSKLLHDEIYQLHCNLQAKEIPHLFFNALMPFQHEVLGDPKLRNNWNDCFLYPYLNEWSYYWHLKNHGFEPTNGNHYLEPAQMHWANILYNYITSKKIL